MERIKNRILFAWHSLNCKHDLALIQSCVDQDLKQKLIDRYSHHERIAVRYKARLAVERYSSL